MRTHLSGALALTLFLPVAAEAQNAAGEPKHESLLQMAAKGTLRAARIVPQIQTRGPQPIDVPAKIMPFFSPAVIAAAQAEDASDLGNVPVPPFAGPVLLNSTDSGER